MKKLPPLGKINPHFFDKVIFPNLGKRRKDVLIGPQHGVDFGVIDMGKKVIAMSSDPFFIQPSLGWRGAAWFAVHIMASDVAVSGIMPTHLCVDLNLPPHIDESAIKKIWYSVSHECAKLNINIISGHTARYAGCNYPMVGGAVMLGIGDKKNLRNPGNTRPGDLIVITKGPAIEATGLMAVQFPEFLKEKFSDTFIKEAQDFFYKMTVVKDAQIASKFSGVVAMHDATECGIWGGLYEMACAGRWGFEVIKEDIVISGVVKKVCEFFRMEPYTSISEGTLIAILRKKDATRLVKDLSKNGIESSIAGRVTERKKGLKVIDNGKPRILRHPTIDPYWRQFEKYLKLQMAKKNK